MAADGIRADVETPIRRRPDDRTVLLGLAGAVAGALCGLLGVAGGVVIVPVLTSRRIGMTRAEASGTTIAAVLPISVAAAVTYAGLHSVDDWAACAIVPGAAAGVIVGSLLASRVRAGVLRALFNLVLLVTAVRMLIVLPERGVHLIGLAAPALLIVDLLGIVAGLPAGCSAAVAARSWSPRSRSGSGLPSRSHREPRCSP